MAWLLVAVLFAVLAAPSGFAAAAKTHSKTHHKRTSRHYRRRRVVHRSSYQTHPTPERYKQIQQALADKGFFKGDVNGVWGADSTDALQRFQTAQKLPSDDGKIDSLSLIALGLGPKHESSVPVSHQQPSQNPAANTSSSQPQ